MLTYAALLTLHPDSADKNISVNIVLHPSDTIPVGQGIKKLGDCTLAELRQYADQQELILAAEHAHRPIKELILLDELSVRIELNQTMLNLLDSLDEAVVLQPLPLSPTEERVEKQESAEIADDQAPLSIADTEPTQITPPATALETAEVTIVNAAPTEPIHAERVTTEERDRGEIANSSADRTAGKLIEYIYPHAVHIFLDEKPLRAMQRHALSSMEREVAGVMLGKVPEKQPDGRFVVHVIDALIAKHTKMSGASVTYTPESWRYLNDQIALKYPQEEVVMVGWYHTHPGFGIFLSNMDLFIHTHFFTQPWHIAYVLDPHAHKSGFFSWDEDQRKVLAYPCAWPQWASKSW